MAFPIAAWGPVIAGATALQSSITGKHEAVRNREWQQSMSNTSHQREVADLKAAGLNPILSAGGGGASTPTGGQANLPSMPDISGLLQLEQDQQRINIEKANSTAGIAKTLSERDLNKANTLIRQGGKLSEWLGTSGGQLMNHMQRSVVNPQGKFKQMMNPDAQPGTGMQRSTNKGTGLP